MCQGVYRVRVSNMEVDIINYLEFNSFYAFFFKPHSFMILHVYSSKLKFLHVDVLAFQ